MSFKNRDRQGDEEKQRPHLVVSLSFRLFVTMDHMLRITAVIQTLEDNTHLAEGLFFPEVSRYGADRKRLRRALERTARRIYEKLPLPEL